MMEQCERRPPPQAWPWARSGQASGSRRLSLYTNTMLIHHKYNANIIDIQCKYTHSTCTSSANTIYSQEYKLRCHQQHITKYSSCIGRSQKLKRVKIHKNQRIPSSHLESVFITMALGEMVFEEINDTVQIALIEISQ